MRTRIRVVAIVAAAVALMTAVGCRVVGARDKAEGAEPGAKAPPAVARIIYTSDDAPGTPKLEDLPLKERVSQYAIT